MNATTIKALECVGRFYGQDVKSQIELSLVGNPDPTGKDFRRSLLAFLFPPNCIAHTIEEQPFGPHPGLCMLDTEALDRMGVIPEAA